MFLDVSVMFHIITLTTTSKKCNDLEEIQQTKSFFQASYEMLCQFSFSLFVYIYIWSFYCLILFYQFLKMHRNCHESFGTTKQQQQKSIEQNYIYFFPNVFILPQSLAYCNLKLYAAV